MAKRSHRKIPLAMSLLSAGFAVEVSDDFELLDVNDLICRGRDGFVAFIVTGDSMVDFIHPGWVVFVDTYAEPKNGDIVVASLGDKNCVKYFQNKSNGLHLVSKNPNYKPVRVRESDGFRIVGVVRGHVAVYG
jgi:SOS-response transcriptional repressor LexA